MAKKLTVKDLLRKPDEVSIWKRGFAFLVDLLIIEFIVNLTFKDYIGTNLGNDKNVIEMYRYLNANYELFSGFLLTMSIITALIALIYFTLLEWKLNQTLGKMIFKIKVMPDKLKFYQALLRNLPKVLFLINYVSWIFLFDLIYLSFTRIRFFDKLAKTYLAKVK